MNTWTDTEKRLIYIGLTLGGPVADAVKKAIFHDHGVDWRALIPMADDMRVTADSLTLLAEREIERQQDAEDAAGTVTMPLWFTNELTAQWIERQIDVQRLSSVTLERDAQVQP